MTSNSVQFSFTISPVLPSLNNLNFSSILTTNLDNCTVTTNYDGNGLLIITVDYATPLQDQTLNFTLSPQNLGG